MFISEECRTKRLNRYTRALSFGPLTWKQSTLKHIFLFVCLTILNLNSRTSKAFHELDLLSLSSFISHCALGSQRLILPPPKKKHILACVFGLKKPYIFNSLAAELASSPFNWTIIIPYWASWLFSLHLYIASAFIPSGIFRNIQETAHKSQSQGI